METHNRLRSAVATGQTSQPAAGDMRQLEWDQELARAAQAHADNCVFRHDCAVCRRDQRWFVGQNLLRDIGEEYQLPDWSFTVQSWFREIRDYPDTGAMFIL